MTQVIEQNMNGLDGLMYMSSTSDAAGNASIILTFKTGTSPDIAQVQVQNKLQLAMPSLPQEVQQQGISVDKSSSNILMVAGFISDNNSLSQYDIADYVASNIKDPISRTAGVGSVQLFGSQYAMRIWLIRKSSTSITSHLRTSLPSSKFRTIRYRVGSWEACLSQPISS